MTQQSVVSQEFIDLSIDDVLDPNFDPVPAFWRSIKVFQMAFAGYVEVDRQLFQLKFGEFVNAMKELYNLPVVDMTTYQQLWADILKHRIQMTVGIIKAKGLNRCVGLKVRITLRTLNHEQELNMNSERQKVFYDISVTYAELAGLKRSNDQIRVEVQAQSWSDSTEQLRHFSIGCREISSEGFEDWFDFGRGLQLLIKIQNRVTIEPNTNPEYIAQFHLDAINRMLRRRVDHYNTQGVTMGKMHRVSANKTKVSYVRKRVDLQSEQSYWPTTRISSDLMNEIRTAGRLTGVRAQKFVKYTDIQISEFFEDEYEDSGCLCSEWCNWNAFFHFNPIYRCLMVNHAQLFINNKTNIADMYVAVICGNIRVVNTMTPRPKTPVLHLLKSANYYRTLNAQTHCLQSYNWRNAYRASQPPFRQLIGISFKILKDVVIIPALISELSVDPFADICLETFIDFHNVYTDLSSAVGEIRQFVARDMVGFWYRTFDKFSRNIYREYLGMAYKRKEHFIDYDFLFSEDYEYSDAFVEEEGRDVKAMRDAVYKFASPSNPLQIRVNLSSQASIFASVYKFVRKVDPKLATVRTGGALHQICVCFNNFDEQMKTWSSDPSKPFHFATDFEQQSGQQISAQMLKCYHIFYTLKLYFMSFGIQQKCIESLINWNAATSQDFKTQVCVLFDYIWRNDRIESKYRAVHNEDLFTVSRDIRLFVNDFYMTYWKRGMHENLTPQQVGMNSINSSLVSVIFQYRRLYFWWRNNGDDRRKFRAVIDTFEAIQKEVVDRTLDINDNQIMYGINSILNYPNHIAVFDHLVYYLVKAFCSRILSTTAEFLKCLHGLQQQHLIDSHQNYILSKPGWVLLFRTMHSTFRKLNEIRTEFVLYEDENDRIGNSLDQTKTLIKDIYRQFYKKLTAEWLNEIYFLIQVNNGPVHQFGAFVILLHTISGFAFLSAFIDDFRFSSRHMRKLVNMVIGQTPLPNCPQMNPLSSLIAGIRNYSRDKRAIALAQPFLSGVWQQRFAKLFQNFNADTQDILFIDLIEADITL